MKLIKKTKSAENVVIETAKYTDLRQVMDYTRPLSIFFSGVEYESYLDILYDLGVRNFLMSYEYLKGKGHSQLKKYHDMHLFIDSGAFTYMNDPKYEEYTIEQWEEQIKTYLAWAERHKNQIFAIADLDLQYIVGNEVVYEWRKKYFEPFMLRTGIPVCFMYHDEGPEQWEYMCKRYPYVGMSLRIDGETQDNFRDMFKIAEKYNTLVQGMASTNTSLLTQLPFYTVDSTTWNVGLKYGEISVWNETKMSRIKKTEFESKAFPIIAKYDMAFDFDKILNEDKVELIRVNAYAFIAAEKFVRERLKAKMYWFKLRAQKTDVNNLPSDFFPTQEWFDNNGGDDLAEYCRKCNINPEYEGAFNLLYDLTAFMTWGDEEHSKMHEWYSEEEQSSLIDDLHDTYINRIVPDKEAKIQDLIDFFKSCVSGENDKLLHLGTNFDRTIRERDNYIEEDNDELVDISTEEVREQLRNLIPPNLLTDSEAPEIDELDEEIFRKAEITPIYDENHKLIKGQKTVHRPKKVYSDKYPKLSCDTCYAAAKCPEYKAGYVCAYNKMFNRFSTRDMSDIIQSVQGMVEYNMSRMQKAMIMETLNGTIDPTVTGLMDTNIRYMQMLKQMYENGSPEVLRQTKVVRADGTQETTTSITNPQGGGIMEKLLGSLMQKPEEPKEEEKEVIDVAPTPEE